MRPASQGERTTPLVVRADADPDRIFPFADRATGPKGTKADAAHNPGRREGRLTPTTPSGSRALPPR